MLLRKDLSCWLVAFALTTGGLFACKPPTNPKAPVSAIQDPIPPHDEIEFDSQVLKQRRKIAVFVPERYQLEPSMQFPVLYMADGGIDEDFPHVVATIKKLIAAGTIPPMLVVGVKNVDRYYDLTTPAQNARWRKRIPNSGGSQAFLDFFANELQTLIQERYRVQDQPTAIVGESLAGLFSVNGWLERPEAFNVWIAIDPSLGWNDGEPARNAKRFVAIKPRDPDHILFITAAGQKGFGNLESAQTFVNELRRLNVSPKLVTFEIQPKLGHDKIFRATESQIYQDMLGPWLKSRPAPSIVH